MKIAMLSWESLHSIAIGGLAPHVSELSSALQRRGHEVHLFTRMGMGQSRYDVIDGVHYHRCPFDPHSDFVTSMERMCGSFVWHLAETEHDLGEPFDIVHGHDWLSAKALVQVKNERHRPSVLTVHSTEYGRCGNSIWDDEMSGRIRAAEWEGTYVADRIICVSRALGDEVEHLYHAPSDKVHVVYNGVNAHKYDGVVDVPRIKKSYSIGADDPLVLFAGRMTWQKGPDILMDAIPGVLLEHPRTKVIFAGDGDMRAGLEARASATGLAKSTRFLGHRNGRELVSLFKSADVVCVPSRNEPFGIVILEAWSATKPVVATLTGGPKEFVQHELNGLTVETGVESIGGGINTLLGNAESARQMGRNGRREVELRFSWEHAAVATERVYEQTALAVSTEIHRKQELRDMARQRVISQENKVKTAPPAPRTDGTALPKKTGLPEEAPLREQTGSSIQTGLPETHSCEQTHSWEQTQEEIRKRAYAIYLARRGAPGNAVSDWLQAERELRELRSLKPQPDRRRSIPAS